MRLLPYRTAWVLPAMLLMSGSYAASGAQRPAVAPVNLVRKTVQNEINAIGKGAKFMFRDRKETPRGSETKLMVETRDAMAGILIAIDDHPLTPEQRQAEDARVDRFVKDPEELSRRRQHEKEDSERIDRIMRALPDAFLYEYAGTEACRPGL